MNKFNVTFVEIEFENQPYPYARKLNNKTIKKILNQHKIMKNLKKKILKTKNEMEDLNYNIFD